MDELKKESDLEGLYLSCSCWYHNQHEYEFTLRLNEISQINTRNFTISGDIIEIDDTGLIQSFRDRIVPKKLLNVILVYNFEDRTMKFEKKDERISNKTRRWRRKELVYIVRICWKILFCSLYYATLKCDIEYGKEKN